ncbi:MAG TPA: NUDIX hydrolase [Candidatus Dormibacteraeota bacterium]
MGAREVRIRVAVCILDGDRILLVQHLKNGRRYWLLPGGGVEVGETLAEAAQRELREETGYDIELGRLLLVCESLEPRGRHLVNLVFGGEVRGGRLRAGLDGRLVDAGWEPVDDLAVLEMYPPIGAEVLACCREGLAGEVRVLGNVWRDHAGGGAADSRAGETGG